VINHILFYVALTFMLIHEMDAVRCREWRIFPGLSSLKEPLAFRMFIVAHIPLFFTLFWSLKTLKDPSELIFWLDIFFALHVFLHLLFLRHKNNEFKDWISWTFISGAGLFGILDVFVSK
jgi:hypothetical protein